MSAMAQIGAWSFHPLITSFPSTILPNIQYWNVTNGTWEYQVQLSYPLNWTSPETESVVDTMYVLDGNALAQTATEAFRKRRPVTFYQPDTIVVSIGYPTTLPNSPYSDGRSYDYQPPVCANCTPAAEPGVPSNADNFIHFLDLVLRPWVQKKAFPGAKFNRDALYGHSFGGLFVVYALAVRPDLFDTFLTASPALFWNNGYILDNLGALTNSGTPPRQEGSNATRPYDKPALQISYGAIEQYPVKGRTESPELFEQRKALFSSLKMTDNCNQLYNAVKNSSALRNADLHVYPFSDHAAVGGVALSDGIDYFIDW